MPAPGRRPGVFFARARPGRSGFFCACVCISARLFARKLSVTLFMLGGSAYARRQYGGRLVFPAVCAVCALLSGVIAASALGGGGGSPTRSIRFSYPSSPAVTELWNSAQDAGRAGARRHARGAERTAARTPDGDQAPAPRDCGRRTPSCAVCSGSGMRTRSFRAPYTPASAAEAVGALLALPDRLRRGRRRVGRRSRSSRQTALPAGWSRPAAARARVAPLSDARYSVGAYIPRTKTGVVSGDAAGGGLGCRVSYVAGSEAVIPGDVVETSGLGGVFRGLRIGRVEAALPGDQLYTSAARIAPAVDYERMREVLCRRRFFAVAGRSVRQAAISAPFSGMFCTPRCCFTCILCRHAAPPGSRRAGPNLRCPCPGCRVVLRPVGRHGVRACRRDSLRRAVRADAVGRACAGRVPAVRLCGRCCAAQAAQCARPPRLWPWSARSALASRRSLCR